MSDSTLKKILSDSAEINRFLNQIESNKENYLKGLSGSLKALFLTVLLEKKQRPICYVTAEEKEEEIVREDLEVLVGHEHIAYFPEIPVVSTKEVFDATKRSTVLDGLTKLLEKRKVVTILSAKNLVVNFPDSSLVQKQRIFLRVNSEINFDTLKERLNLLGFEREPMVQDWGEMSVRGGLIDFYPYSSDFPYRVEFFGDTIESIRVFDPKTQRSKKKIESLSVYPQQAGDLQSRELSQIRSVFDYLKKDTILFFDEEALIEKTLDEQRELADFYADKLDNRDKKFSSEKIFSYDKIKEKTEQFTNVIHNSFQITKKREYTNFGTQPQESIHGNLQLFKKKVENFTKENSRYNGTSRIFFLCDSREKIERMEDLFQENDIDLSKIQFMKLGLNQGFVFKSLGMAVFTDNQFYGRQIRWRRRKRVRRGFSPQQLKTLNVGDFVVHVDKGIGKYQGLKKIKVGEHERECLKILYKDGDLLYVPIERMDRIQKYAAKEGAVPVLSKLGSKEWERLKQKTKKQIKKLARELTLLYAKRKMENGFAFSKDTTWQRELEASFEYEDTPDQKRATQDIKFDMEQKYPMDRLICGDVGFGKTEVAVRAAFKAVEDNKQVAVLVPTTILALQHYNLIRDRLRKYPMKIDMLSRFRTRSDQKRIIDKLITGQIDIVIGTHRILSKDVQFKDLGLLIIDEEHRFGVQKKESLKKKYLNVDVLSMSATPIPRTLNLSLLGIRDMSIISTPPLNRYPIHTEVASFDAELIRMAILKEVDRDGQVFFVHNRVQTIESMANFIRRLVPEVNVAVAHGQMDEKLLEKVMWDFATGKYQCLVSTMIIESGLDIPRVNTLIINRADTFGLSQLYQIRGRVGRSDQHAYAYLLVPSIKSLNHNAFKRLRIIEEFTDLGAGLNVAMRDLEIRGAGNILGAEQSGHIIALGYELYTKIIEEAVKELKQEREGKPEIGALQEKEIKVDIDKDAYLPDQYINQSELKVDIYRRLANVSDLASLNKIREEVRDRFGLMPVTVENLFNLIELKLIAKQLKFKKIKIQGKKLFSYFDEEVYSPDNGELIKNKISWIINKAKGDFQFIQNEKRGFGIRLNIPESEKNSIEYCKKFLKTIL